MRYRGCDGLHGPLVLVQQSAIASKRLAAKKSKSAVDRIIEEFSNTYDPGLQGADGANPNPGGEVIIGPGAFKNKAYLAGVIGHEFRHEAQRDERRHVDTTRGGGANEAEAYYYNIRNATRFRSSPADIEHYWSEYKKYSRGLTDEERAEIESYDFSTP